MAQGYAFEDEVESILKLTFKTQKNYFGLAADKGKRREIDIVATQDIPPLGEIHFLVECKAMKVGKIPVEEFYNKILELRAGKDPYCCGIPILVAKDGFTQPAIDEAHAKGIILLSVAQLQDADIPPPRSVERFLTQLEAKWSAALQLDAQTDIPDFGVTKIAKVNTDFTVRGLGTFEYYAEFIAGKFYVFVFGFYLGHLQEEVLIAKVKGIENYLKKEQEKTGKKPVYLGRIGFFIETLSPDQRKLVEKLNRQSEQTVAVCFIETSTAKVFGNLTCKPFFLR